MSITRDFEKKDGKCCECGSFDGRDVLALLSHARSLEADFAELRKHNAVLAEVTHNAVEKSCLLEAQNKKLKAMLKKHQWLTNSDGDKVCPECSRCWATTGHSPDCALAKLMGE